MSPLNSSSLTSERATVFIGLTRLIEPRLGVGPSRRWRGRGLHRLKEVCFCYKESLRLLAAFLLANNRDVK
jgi:hypothetical protein